jgi:hypothetical protein
VYWPKPAVASYVQNASEAQITKLLLLLLKNAQAFVDDSFAGNAAPNKSACKSVVFTTFKSGAFKIYLFSLRFRSSSPSGMTMLEIKLVGLY